jgi:hypothetical protein
LWNLVVRVLAASDPGDEARLVSRELAADLTGEELAHLLPEGVRVASLGGETWKDTEYLRPDVREVRGAEAELVVIEVDALGSEGFVARRGAQALCARGLPIWLIAPTGVVVSDPVWHRITERMSAKTGSYEVVPRTDGVRLVGPAGEESWAIALTRAAPEAPPPTLR